MILDLKNRVIKIQTHLPNYVYEVDIDTCKTHEQKIDWIDHLKGKNWFTNEMLVDFIKLIENIK